MGRRDRTIFLAIAVAVVLALHIYLSDDEFPADARADPRRSLRLNDPKALTNEITPAPWTEEEHELFLRVVEKYGPSRWAWRHIADKQLAGKRSTDQVQAHWREHVANRNDPDYLPYAPSSTELQTELADEGPIDASDGAAMNAGPWTKDEHDLFLRGKAHFGTPGKKTWNRVAREFVPTRSGEEVRDHWREYAANRDDPDYLPYALSSPELQTELADEGPIDARDGAATNKGPWTKDEHELFLRGLDHFGEPCRKTWNGVARMFVGTRSGEEVQDHWREMAAHRDDPDYLPYDKGPWTEEEHALFLRGLEIMGAANGGAWRRIAQQFVDTRTVDEVQDHWREYYANRNDPNYLHHDREADGAAPANTGRAKTEPKTPSFRSLPNPELHLADPRLAPKSTNTNKATPVDTGTSTGPWSEEEHDLFLQGLGMHGVSLESWAKIAEEFVRTRSSDEVRDHADEYFRENAQGYVAPSEVFGWPGEDVTEVATGTYFYRGQNHWKGDKMRFFQMPRPKQGYGRVLLYISSHFSRTHENFLRYCWKNVLARSPLLRDADIAVHLNPNLETQRKPAMDLLTDVFEGHNLMVYVRNYEGALLEGGTPTKRLKIKQTGASMAMYEAVQHKYFEGYDWVIRVNPDVLIRDDSYLREAMSNPALSALLINCKQRSLHLHTDFFVLRPGVLLADEFPRELLGGGSEMSFTTSMINPVIKSHPRNYEWIPGANPAEGYGCRAGAGKDYFDSPVVHQHSMHPDICSVPEA